MFVPCIYPEPNNIKLSAGYFEIGGSTGAYVDEAVINEFPGILEMTACCLETGIRITDAEGSGIVIRKLSGEDVCFVSSYFKREYLSGNLKEDTFFMHINDNKVTIAALVKEGFFYALQMLKHLLLRKNGCGNTLIKNCVIFDYAYKKVRAVSIKVRQHEDMTILKKLIRVMADLRYNTLIAEMNSYAFSEKDRAELDALCKRYFIKLVPYGKESMNIIDNLDGPAFLDWEHKSGNRQKDGAAVSFTGNIDEKEMAGAGFLFNLAYSSYMLWNEEYNNFSWEKVMDLALSYMPIVMQTFDEIKLHSLGCSDADMFPVPLQYCREKYRVRPLIGTASGKTAKIAFVGERAKSMVFSHAIEGKDPCGDDTAAGIVGYYTVYYKDGSFKEIQLAENLNIGRDNVWWGRRYNPGKYLFDTDICLQRLSCFARPRKRALDNGKLAAIYDFEWINPEPGKVVEEVSCTVYSEEKTFNVCVYGLNLVL